MLLVVIHVGWDISEVFFFEWCDDCKRWGNLPSNPGTRLFELIFITSLQVLNITHSRSLISSCSSEQQWRWVECKMLRILDEKKETSPFPSFLMNHSFSKNNRRSTEHTQESQVEMEEEDERERRKTTTTSLVERDSCTLSFNTFVKTMQCNIFEFWDEWNGVKCRAQSSVDVCVCWFPFESHSYSYALLSSRSFPPLACRESFKA